tara:strand:+ start:222 stop:467 length:246 start_codon:yes stop_codon:yes gene_type:complete
MKITKTQLRNLIKEELEEGIMDNLSGMFGSEESAKPMGRSAAEVESENNLVNAVLDLQELHGAAHVVNVLKEMIISIEAGR